MTWALPEDEQLIDLTKISSDVGKFVARLKHQADGLGADASVDGSGTSDLDYEDSEDERPSVVTRNLSYHNRRRLKKVLKGPTARQEAELMPWLYFRQMSMAVIFVWVATLMGTIAIEVDNLLISGADASDDAGGPSLKRPKASTISLPVQSLHVTWPHATFLP